MLGVTSRSEFDYLTSGDNPLPQIWLKGFDEDEPQLWEIISQDENCVFVGKRIPGREARKTSDYKVLKLDITGCEDRDVPGILIGAEVPIHNVMMDFYDSKENRGMISIENYQKKKEVAPYEAIKHQGSQIEKLRIFKFFESKGLDQKQMMRLEYGPRRRVPNRGQKSPGRY